MTVSFILEGSDEIADDVIALSIASEGVVYDSVGEWVAEQPGRLRRTPYAPERPGQQYVRTGNLGRNYEQRQISRSRYLISNAMDYSEWVVGSPDEQGFYFVGRWWSAIDIVEDDLDSLEEIIQRKIEARARRQFQ